MMASHVKDYVSKCDVCLAHGLLVVSDYFSNYIEVAHLCSTTTQAVVRELMTMFVRFGIPEILVTDNGLQFSFNEFQVFAKSWSFNHVTASPLHPQSNGKAENVLRTVKRLFEKCKETSVSEFQALLDWRNTPSEGMDTSPAQHLMGLRCRTLLAANVGVSFETELSITQ